VPFRAYAKSSYGVTITGSTGGAVDTTPPNNVTNLTTSSVLQTTLTLNWTASTSSDIASYDVYNGSTLLGNVTGTTYSVTGLTTNTTYTFTVKAKDTSNNVASGTSVNVTTLVNPPADVTNLTTNGLTFSSVTLNWTASATATSYDVYNGATLLGNVTTTSYNVTGLSATTSYTFKVIAKNAGGSSTGATTTVTTPASTDTTPPAEVINLTAGTATINSIPVTWTLSNSTDVANYEVAYSTDGGTTYTVASSAVNSSSTSYTITGLTAGTSYTIRVVGIDTSSNRSAGATTTSSTATAVTYTVSASPAAGTYGSTQNVTLSVSPTGATIYYTTDGTTPTTSSSVYSTAIVVSATTTIKYFAQDNVGNATSVQTSTYTIDTVAPTVTISPVAGTYGSTQSITLSANETATIYYTIDGTTPTSSSTVYSTPISVSVTTTVKYFAVDTVGNSSAVQSATYTIVANAAPTLSSTYSTTSVTSADVISIPFTLSDDTDTILSVACVTDGTTRTINFPTGSNTWNVGTLSPGSHTLTLQATDSGSLTSNTLTFNITSTARTLSTSVSSGLVSSWNFENLASGATTVSDSTGSNALAVGTAFTNNANIVSDGGVTGDGTGTMASPNLLASAGDYTIAVTYKFKQNPNNYATYYNENIFSIASDLNLNLKATNYQIRVNATSNNPTVYPAHLHHDTAVIKVDSVNNQASFYLNGSLVATYAYTVGTTIPKLILFGGPYAPGTTNDRGYSTFKNALFWNRQLTDTEISTVTNEITRTDGDVFNTTNTITTVNYGLIDAYDLVASQLADTYVTSVVGIHKLWKSTAPTKNADGSMVGGVFKPYYSSYRPNKSHTFVFKGTRARKDNDDFFSYMGADFGHDVNDMVFVKINGTKYCQNSVTDTSIHTFIMTLDDDGTNTTFKFYLDGVYKTSQVITNSTLGNSYPAIFTSTNSGMSTYAVDSTQTDSRYKILNYKRALTQAEITKLHSDLMATT
jgi:hypothetical protein